MPLDTSIVDNEPKPLDTSIVDAPEPSAKSKDEILAESKANIEKGFDGTDWKDRIYANAKGYYVGLLNFGSTLTKIGEQTEKGIHNLVGKAFGVDDAYDKIDGGMGKLFKGEGAQAQAAYENAEADYQKNANKYPETAISKFLGELTAQAPLYSGSLLTKGVELGGKLAGPTGEVLGSMLTGGGTMALSGGLRNEVGQAPDKIWNDSGEATTMGVIGAALGPLGGIVLPKWGEATTKYAAAKEGLKNAGYEGPVLARDFTTDGVVRNIKNKLLDNLPLVTTAVRNNQIAGIDNAVRKVVGQVSEKTVGQTEQRIGGIINKVRDTMAQTGDDMWNKMFSTAKSQIKHVNLGDETKALTKSILTNHIDDIANRDKQALLHPILNYKAIAPEQLHKLKRDIWSSYVKAAKKDTTAQENLANSLKDLYWKVDEDIGNAFKAVPELNNQYQAAKAYTTKMFDIFDPKNDRPLMKAVSEVNEKGENLKGFINSIMKPKSQNTAGYYDRVFGSQYSKETEKLALQKSFQQSLDYNTGDLHLGNFFKNAEQAAGNNIIKNDTWSALKGLEQYTQTVNKAMKASQAAGGHNIQQAAQFGSMGAAATLAGVGEPVMAGSTLGGLILGAKTLGWISKHSPVKNALIGLSNVWGKNPQITRRLVDSIGRQLPKVGVTILQEGEDTRINKEGK